MKKIFTALSICFILAVATAFSVSVFAADDNSIETQLLLPSAYLEYAELNEPIDVFVSGDTYAIAERQRLLIYRNQMWTEILLENSFGVSKIALYDDYLIFLSNSNIFYIDLNGDLTQKIHLLDNVSSSFSIYGDVIATNTSSFINFYDIVKNDSLLSFNLTSSKSVGTTTALCLTAPDKLYYVNEQTLFVSNSDVPLAINLPASARCSAFGDDTLYITTASQGVWSIDLKTNAAIELIRVSADVSLNNVVQPQGIFYLNGKLLLCDSAVNAISEYDIKTNSFTGFFITDKEADNRLSKNSKTISADGDNLYVLDGNAVKVYNKTEKNCSKLEHTVPNSTLLAVNKNYFLISDSASLNLFRLTNNQLQRVSVEADLSVFKNVTAVCSHENDFYILNNEISSSVPIVALYRLSAKDLSLTRVAEVKGRGEAVTVDLFGRVFVAASDNSLHSLNLIASPDFLPQQIYSSSLAVLSLSVDYTGNLYFLTDNNKVMRVDAEAFTAEEFTISISPNLPSGLNALDMLLDAENDAAYFLTEGLLFKASGVEIKLSAPDRIAVSSLYDTSFKPSFNAVKLKQGSKIFAVDLENTAIDAEFYVYEKTAVDDGSMTYLVVYSETEFSLLVNNDGAVIARTADLVNQTVTITDDNQTRYFILDGHLYNYPVYLSPFASDAVSENQSVTVTKTFTINETEYAIVSLSNGKSGFVASAALKNAATQNVETISFKLLTVKKEGAKLYSDEGLTVELASLEGGREVEVYEDENGILKISYNGGFAYLSKNDIEPMGKHSVRNLIVTVLIIIAIISSIVFLLRKKIFKKVGED